MTTFLRFLGWATLAFVLAWFVSRPYERFIAGVAGAIAAPGSQVEWVDLEIFFPFDLSVYAALCLSSTWTSWKARWRALGLGIAVLIIVELMVLVFAMKLLLGSATGTETQVEQTQRFVVGLIRVMGLVAAGATWTWFLGWERLPQVTRSIEAHVRTAGGKKP